MSQLSKKLSGDIQEALFFGSQNAIDSLEVMNKRINSAIAEADKGTTQHEAALKIRNEFARVYSVLAQDVRQHLDLEDLPEMKKPLSPDPE
jgi:hypothetical protein